jgi:hypothetical protein
VFSAQYPSTANVIPTGLSGVSKIAIFAVFGAILLISLLLIVIVGKKNPSTGSSSSTSASSSSGTRPSSYQTTSSETNQQLRRSPTMETLPVYKPHVESTSIPMPGQLECPEFEVCVDELVLFYDDSRHLPPPLPVLPPPIYSESVGHVA